MSTANAIATIEAETLVDQMGEDQRERALIRLLALQNTNPAEVGFPAMLPMEIALKIDSPQNICRAYGISKQDFGVMISHPVFIKAYQEAVEALKVDGMSFKVKAQMQAEDYLKTAFQMVKNPAVADNVRADLIKNTIRWAGYDAKAVDTALPGGGAFHININLG
jgi:hypothetical protein